MDISSSFITENDTICLYGQISPYDSCSASSFIEAAERIKASGASRIKVRIISGGGSVYEGLAIYNYIVNSSVPIDTYVDGIAASIASVIALSGKKRYMNDFAKIMIHNAYYPSVDESDLDEKDKEALRNVNDIISSIYDSNTKKSKQELMDLMAQEKWISAEEAYEFGFIDELPIKTARDMAAMVQDYVNTYKQVLFGKNIEKNNSKQLIMKELVQLLGLPETSNEKQVLDTVNKLKSDLAEANNKASEFSAKVEKLRDMNAQLMVDSAISAGTVKAEASEKLLEVARKSPELFSTMVASVNVKNEVVPSVNHVDIASLIKVIDKKKESSDSGRESWTIRDWEKKDPKGLESMCINNPSAYKELYDSFYKKNQA